MTVITNRERAAKGYQTNLVPECREMIFSERHMVIWRRVRGDLIEVYSNNLDEIDKEILPMWNYGGTRNQGDKLRRKFSKTIY